MNETIENKIDSELAHVEKPYHFRKLSSDDIFLMISIISKIGVNEFKKCFGSEGVMEVVKNMSTEEKQNDSGAMLAAGAVALEAVNIILKNIGRCKSEIYELLAQTSNLTIEEITAEGNAVMFVEMVVDFFKKEEFPNFIKVVSKLSN